MTEHQASNGATVLPYEGVPASHVLVDGTAWPVDGDGEGSIEWRLRYAVDTPTPRGEQLVAASILSSYEYLTCPSLTQRDAFASLKRARKARAAAEEFNGLRRRGPRV